MFYLKGKRVFTAYLAIVILLPVPAIAQGGRISETEQIKARANTYHTSGKAKVSVELKDGRSYKGRITAVEEDHFTLVDPNAARDVQIRYDSVSKLRKRGMSRGAKTAIWVGVAAGIGALIIFGPKNGPFDTICPISCRK
jgi:small nuclear ribonucleoprotein (snRNP)-like protein